jgi:membrane-associated phospholipid phosphatase
MSRTSTIANWLSRLFHPFLVAAVAMFLILWFSSVTVQESLKWTLLSIAIVIIPSAILLGVQYQRGGVTDLDISIREQRYKLYGLGALSLLLLLVVGYIANAPTVFFACIYAAAVATLFGALINKFVTKISIHSAALAGVASVMGFISPISAVISWVLWIIVGWARVHLEKHTVSQVLLGCAVAFACVWAVFGFFY